MTQVLTPQEKSFLDRQMRNTSRYLIFAILGVGAAVLLGISFYVNGSFNGTRFALIVLILLHARGNLKQHKDAKLFHKLHGTD